MNESIKRRIAMSLQCELEDVPEDDLELRNALNKRRKDMKKAKEAKHG